MSEYKKVYVTNTGEVNDLGQSLYVIHESPIPIVGAYVLYDKLAPVCSHKNTSPDWDYVKCNDCGAVLCHLIGSKSGAEERAWFESLSMYKEYKKTGVRS